MPEIPRRPKYEIKTYYSERKKGKTSKDLSSIGKHFIEIFDSFQRHGYFDEAFGSYCVDGNYSGYLNKSLDDSLKFVVGKKVWRFEDNWEKISEDNFFDIVEFLYTHISKPVSGEYHSYGDCGYHYQTFDKAAGRQEFCDEINSLISDYKDGFFLASNGEIQQLVSQALQRIIGKNTPTSEKESIENKIRLAEEKFLRQKSSLEDRREAIRTLADVLEFIRPQIKKVLISEDEKDLFNIVNNFGIRHHNQIQKTNYDQVVWLSWMFHFYLASIHACLHLLDRSNKS